MSGFRGVLLIPWILSIVAIAEIVMTKFMGTAMNIPAKRGQIHMIVGAVAAVFTLLGFVAKTTGLTISWGLIVGLILSLVWAYGGYMMNSEPDAAARPIGARRRGRRLHRLIPAHHVVPGPGRRRRPGPGRSRLPPGVALWPPEGG